MHAEQALQTETARVLAQMQANLTSIPSELRAVAEAQKSKPNIDVTTHMRMQQHIWASRTKIITKQACSSYGATCQI